METGIDQDQGGKTINLGRVHVQEMKDAIDQAQGIVQTGRMIDIGHTVQDNIFLSFSTSQEFLPSSRMSHAEIYPIWNCDLN